MRVSLSKSDRGFSVGPNQPLLDAALDAGLNLPHGCKGGNCGACRARLLQGQVRYPNGRPLGLSDGEVKEGFILLCQARALSELSIEVLEIRTPDTALIKRLPSRIERIETLSHDVLGVYLRLPAAEMFSFEPGQYLDVILPQGRRRSFSIASPPHDSRLIELHVRRVPGGEFTERLFTDGSHSTLLTVEGPLGQFVYRPAAAPLLLVGGGTGLAPLKSILRHVIESDSKRKIILYWGVRSERDLYAHAEMMSLSGRIPDFHYQAVLSEPDTGWRGRRGWVHDAVLQDIEALDACDIYASGPPAMIAAVRQEFRAHGADSRRLFFDSFDYAPDTLERQRSRDATKS